MGVIHEKDRALQERMENHLVGDLRALGYNAYSVLNEYGPKMFDNLSEQEANKKLQADSVDAVLTIVLLDKEKERYYVPSHVIFTPYYRYHNRFWGYYTTMHNRIITPGYYAVNTKYFWESNLYDLTTNELIYSVQTQSFNPFSTDDLAHQYGKMIVENMQKNNVLTKQGAAVTKPM